MILSVAKARAYSSRSSTDNYVFTFDNIQRFKPFTGILFDIYLAVLVK